MSPHFVVKILKYDWVHFIYTDLNGFKYFYLTRIILFNINYLFAHSEVKSIVMYNLQFNYRLLFKHSQMIKQIYY